MNSFAQRLFVLFFFILFSGCEYSQNAKEVYEPEYSTTPLVKKKPIYIFGVPPYHNAKQIFKIYQPMIDLINEELKDGKLRLETSRSFGVFEDKIALGHFAFALPNPYETITALEQGYEIFAKMGDDEDFRGIILVRKDSGIKKLDDLRGNHIVYPAPTALAAAMMPQWYLTQEGIDINRDITNGYTGSHDSSIMNVYLGKADAAATWPPPWRAFVKKNPKIAKELTLLWETPSLLNNGLIVHKNIPKDIADKVSEVILALHTHKRGKKILSRMELSRYEVADEETYRIVKEFMIKFEKEIRPKGIK